MRQVLPNINLIEGLRGGNVYLIASDKELTLVDSGMNGDVERIVDQIKGGNFDLTNLQAIILTHAHGDHTGCAAELSRRSGAKVLAHHDEAPYIESAKSFPEPMLIQRIMAWFSDRLLLKLIPCKVDRILEDGDIIDVLGGLRVIHTPGHTIGSISLYQPTERILFCGDLLFNMNPWTGRKGMQLSIPLLSMSMAQVRESVQKLSNLPIEALCFGHGDPVFGDVNKQINTCLVEASASDTHKVSKT